MNDINQLSQLIEEALTEFSEEKEEELAEEIDRLSDAVVENLENNPVLKGLKGTGKYRKSFFVKTLAKGKGFKRNVIANKKHQLTHLLERSHLTRNGVTRTRAFPHWETAQKKLEELSEGVFK